MKKKRVVHKIVQVEQPKRNFFNPTGYWGNTPKVSFGNMPSFVKLPLVGFQKPINNSPPQNPDKKLSYPQTTKKYTLAPFGNWDRDYHMNVFDCRPFDNTKHRVTPSLKDKPVTSASKPGLTYGKLFEELEKTLPKIYKQGGRIEEEHSIRVEDALMRRERTTEEKLNKIFKDIVGTYKIKVPLDLARTKIAVKAIERWLAHAYQDLEFDPIDPANPNVITVYETPKPRPKYDKYDEQGHPDTAHGAQVIKNPITGKVEYEEIPKNAIERKQEKLSKYVDAKKAPKGMMDLMTEFAGEKEITYVISDNPADIIRKSAVYDPSGSLIWHSCETPKCIHPLGADHGPYEKGPFSDIEFRNAIAWVYYEGKEPGRDPPSGRVMIRWGIADDGSVDVGVEEVFYPKGEAESQSLVTGLRKVLVKKGYTLKNIKAPYVYAGYSDNINRSEIREKLARHFGVREPEVSKTNPWYYGLSNPQFELEEELKTTKQKYLERPQKRIPYAMATEFVKETDVDLVRPLGTKDVPEPILKDLSKHENKEVKRTLAGRPFINKENAPVWQQSWVNLSVPIINRLASKSQPEDVRLSLILSDNPLPSGLAEETLADKSVALKLVQDERGRYTISERIAKILIKNSSPEIRERFIQYKLLDDWMGWALPVLVQDKSDEVVLALIRTKSHMFDPKAISHLCEHPSEDVKEALIDKITSERLRVNERQIYNLLTKGAHISDSYMMVLINHMPLEKLDTKTFKLIIHRGSSEFVERILLNKITMLNLDSPERNILYQEIIASGEMTEKTRKLISEDPYINADNAKNLIDLDKDNVTTIVGLINNVELDETKHVLFNYFKKGKILKEHKIKAMNRLLQDMSTSSPLYSIIKKEIIRINTAQPKPIKTEMK